MPLHIGKGRDVSTAISDIIDYVENPQKTDNGRLIYGYECDTRTADAEFLLSKRQYINLTGRQRGADDVIAYHLRQSFMPGEITPEKSNEIGRELALKLTKGNNAFIVCTHIDRHHVHNHIIINSVDLDCIRKFRNFWGSTWAIRRMNDKLCLEYGLSIVENPKPSRGHYGTWLGEEKKPSYQEQLRRIINAVLEERPKDFSDFLEKLKDYGIEVNAERKNLRLKLLGQERFTRCNTLKGDYTEQAIKERINGTRTVMPKRAGRKQTPPKIGLLVDIDAAIRAGKGPGYERWAKTPFAQALNALIDEHSNVKELTEYLGSSPQAINQYRNGQTRPSLESICKIADFYKVSVDYLLGRNPIPSTDYNVQKVHEYTGLTMAAIGELCAMKALNDSKAETDVLSLMLESSEFRYIIGLISLVMSEKIEKDPTLPAAFDFHNIPQEALYASVLNVYTAKLAERMAGRFEQRYHESPQKRKQEWMDAQSRAYAQKNQSVPDGEDIVSRMSAYSRAVERNKEDRATNGND